MATRKELLSAIRQRYEESSRREKSRILDDHVAAIRNLEAERPSLDLERVGLSERMLSGSPPQKEASRAEASEL